MIKYIKFAELPVAGQNRGLEDDRQVKVQFTRVADGVLVKETFEAESENEPEVQRQGWQAILNRFAGHVEAKAPGR